MRRPSRCRCCLAAACLQSIHKINVIIITNISRSTNTKLMKLLYYKNIFLLTFTKSTKENERLISIKSLAKSSDFDPKEVDIFWLFKDLFYGKCIGGHILGEIADCYSKFVQCHIWAYQLKWSCSTRELGRYQECGGCCSAGFKVAFDKDLEASKWASSLFRRLTLVHYGCINTIYPTD